METTASTIPEMIASLLVMDLATIGVVSSAPRLDGYALLEDGVMFGFVEADGTAYLRTSATTAPRFRRHGATKHPHMPYWTIPHRVSADRTTLCALAYEAADMAHLALMFGVHEDPAVVEMSPVLCPLIAMAGSPVLAA